MEVLLFVLFFVVYSFMVVEYTSSKVEIKVNVKPEVKVEEVVMSKVAVEEVVVPKSKSAAKQMEPMESRAAVAQIKIESDPIDSEIGDGYYQLMSLNELQTIAQGKIFNFEDMEKAELVSVLAELPAESVEDEKLRRENEYCEELDAEDEKPKSRFADLVIEELVEASAAIELEIEPQDRFSNMTVKELRDEARGIITGFMKLKKAELIKALRDIN